MTVFQELQLSVYVMDATIHYFPRPRKIRKLNSRNYHIYNKNYMY